MFNKRDTHTTSKSARYISSLEYVLHSGMLNTFIIIYRIISGAELDLAEGPTGHKFHILGQMNRNINEKRLSLSLCISCNRYFECTCIFAMTFANTILLLDMQRYNYSYRLIQIFTNVFLYQIYSTLPRPSAIRKTSTQHFTRMWFYVARRIKLSNIKKSDCFTKKIIHRI